MRTSGRAWNASLPDRTRIDDLRAPDGINAGRFVNVPHKARQRLHTLNESADSVTADVRPVHTIERGAIRRLMADQHFWHILRQSMQAILQKRG